MVKLPYDAWAWVDVDILFDEGTCDQVLDMTFEDSSSW